MGQFSDEALVYSREFATGTAGKAAVDKQRLLSSQYYSRLSWPIKPSQPR